MKMKYLLITLLLLSCKKQIDNTKVVKFDEANLVRVPGTQLSGERFLFTDTSTTIYKGLINPCPCYHKIEWDFIETNIKSEGIVLEIIDEEIVFIK